MASQVNQAICRTLDTSVRVDIKQSPLLLTLVGSCIELALTH